jgi:hypothetical protein
MTALLAAVGLAVVHSLSVWGVYYDPQAAFSPASALTVLIEGFEYALPVAGIVATVTGLYRILNDSSRRRLKLFVLWLSAVLVLSAGFAATTQLKTAYGPGDAKARNISADTVYRTGDAAFYAERRTGTMFEHVLLHREGRSPGFSRHQEAILNPQADTVRIPEGDVSIPSAAFRETAGSLFSVPSTLSQLLYDVRLSSRTLLRDAPPVSDRTLGLIALWSLAMVCAWGLVRMTRWLLFNALLVLAYARGLLFALRAAQDQAVARTVSAWFAFEGTSFVAPLFLVAMSVVLVSVTVLLPSFREWERDMSHG